MPAAAGWVDRAADSPASAAAPIEPPVARPTISKPAPEPGGLSAAGSALAVLGLATMEATAWLSFNILTAPIRLARRLLASDHGGSVGPN
jgi:hypothetical protein